MEAGWDRQRAQQRIPVPSLFVGPPSRRSSFRDHGGLESDLLARDPTNQSQPFHLDQSKVTDRERWESSNSNYAPLADKKAWRPTKDQSNVWQAKAMWAEMQSTLEEVELSAASRANVFSNDHSRALEELRKAQVELARSWAKSEANGNEQEHESVLGDNSNVETNTQTKEMKEVDTNDGAIVDSTKQERQNTRIGSTSTQSKDHLEDTADKDIKLARQRRLANDEQFDRVNRCVVDVVSKLEAVAKKMRNVEAESQEIWDSEKDSSDHAIIS